jgi:pimeloyl-ACP methyl ester carboxylesterase
MMHVLGSSMLFAAAAFVVSLAGSGSAQPVNVEPSGWVRIQRNGKTIEALVEGEGHPAVVVLPGLGGVQSMRSLATRVSRAGHRVVSVRYRGMGNSTGELNGAHLTSYVEDASDLIQALGNEPVHIMGATAGSEIAAAVASARPELIRSLVVIVTPYGPVQLRQPGPDTLAAFRRLMAGPAVADESTIQLARMTLYSPTTKESIIRSDLQLSEARKWPKADAALLTAIRSIRPGPWWEKITAPILAIHGTDDQISPIENARATQKQAGSRIRLIEVEGAGHVLFSEHAERIVTSIVQFLKEH